MISRRDFISLTAAAATGTLIGCGQEKGSLAESILPAPGAGFPASVCTASRRELDAALKVLAGALPADVEGHAFTVGSIPGGDAGPLIAGDGIVYRLSFRSDSVQLVSRMVRTDCYLLDEATQDDEELGFKGQSFIRISPAFGVRNFANTAFTPIQDGRMLVTYDAGRPWEIDPKTLEVITPVGLLSRWEPFLPPMTPSLNFFPLSMTSAHPAYDADEQRTYMVNFAPPVEGLTAQPFTRLLWWDGDSEPQACEVVDEAGNPAVLEMSCHQVNVTQRHVVFLDTAFQLEAESLFGGDPVTRPAYPHLVIWLVAKADLAPEGRVVAKRVVVPIEGAHAVTLRDDSDGVLEIMVAHQNSFDPSEWIAPSDEVYGSGEPVDPAYAGLIAQPADRSVVGRYAIDTATGEVLESKLFSDEESWAFVLYSQDTRGPGDRFGSFYWGTFGYDPELLTQRFVDAYADHPERQVALQRFPEEKQPSQIVRFDADAFEVADRFVMPLGYVGLSPTFVPRVGGSTDQGYVVLFVVSDQGDEIWLFDSEDLGRGPLCRLGHEELDFAFTLHTAWLPELREMSNPTYVVDKTEDYQGRLEGMSARAQARVREVLGV